MCSIKWDPYRSFNIPNRGHESMKCIGFDIFGHRCECDIPPKTVRRIRNYLSTFKYQAPEKAISTLKTLAELCLCEKYHQAQVRDKVFEWKVAIRHAARFYETEMELREKDRKLKKVEKLLDEEISKRRKLGKEVAEMAKEGKKRSSLIESLRSEISFLKERLKHGERQRKR
ncbi:hypothetical protein HYFRA_00002073 [Hymenoscyphus fraxineus]|uniref:Uncharacterized protein n=1 Tax=Hymenoscyphus fraxineus TaxID=746836 RepID=A0A9N9KMZ4_9HELO|nr:hypothetical protein HYFRA_00002073 [Hymenoscyphus fraxineus]